MQTATDVKTDAPAQSGVAADKQVAPQPQRQRVERIVVESEVPVLDTAMFDQMMRIAKVMASSSLVPAHLNMVRGTKDDPITIEEPEAVANCFLVVNQSVRWKMDPFAVAQHTFVTKGKIGYEGKLIGAVINTRPEIVQRLSYAYSGTPGTEGRKVVVSAKIAGDDSEKTVEGDVKNWKTSGSGSPWGNPAQYDQMLSYRGAREWARRWLPEAILGVWGEDELALFDRTSTLIPATDTPVQAQKGAAGLKAALLAGGGGGGGGAVDLPAGSTTFEQAAEQNTAALDEAAKGKPAGTVEQREELVRAYAACADTEVLNLQADKARAYEWTPADQAVLSDAYTKKLAELEG